MASTINAITTGTGGIVATGDTSGIIALQSNGSTIATISTSGYAYSDGSIQTAAASPYVLKNRIINGAMVIDQRNAGASLTPNNTYSLDRWKSGTTQSSKYTVQQNAGSVTPPAGFTNYLGVTSSSAYSITSTDEFSQFQPIEGFNVSDLDFGKATAKTITLSFWVRSSLTGTFGGALNNGALDRSYPYTYTISAANTWEQKSVTIVGDTTGTWLTTNGVGVYVQFGLGVGSNQSKTAGSWQAGYAASATGATSVVGTSGATFYITGVQLEVGSTATPFERRLYDKELISCQRYCYVDGYTGNAYTRFPTCFATNTTQSVIVLNFPVTMRVIPSLTWSGPFMEVVNSGGGATGTSVTITSDGNSTSHAAILFNYSSGTVTNNSLNGVRINNSTSWYARFESEL